MKRETLIWTIVVVLSGIFLLWRGTLGGGMGRQYVKDVPQKFAVIADTDEDGNPIETYVNLRTEDALDYDVSNPIEILEWTVSEQAEYVDYYKAEQEAAENGIAQTEYRLSISRTIGIWVAAFFTLAILSFLYKDNPFYKLAEAIVVGVSAAYWMVVAFWDQLIQNLVASLFPDAVRATVLPGLDAGASVDFMFIVPLMLGVMLLWRLSPVGGWVSRWPMAFMIGVFMGIRLTAFIHADFLSQIRNTIEPLVVMTTDAQGGQSLDILQCIRNLIVVLGVLACIVYFFFSIEHKGVVGKTARVGIWFLMVTFGAAFGYTVMGRIALLSIRFEFLFDDWLWLIDPTESRPEAIGGLIFGLF
ncbi:MAG: hypothetical protein AAF432_05835 [Planctomycetota bacterium]